jgi:hypothetical protein
MDSVATKHVNTTKDVWQILETEGIELIQLKTDQMNDNLIRYLSSYKGLQALQLERVAGEDDAESDRFANAFFRDVLPRHKDTLKILHIRAGYEGDWVSPSLALSRDEPRW